MQRVTANIHVCRSFICQLSAVRCAACPQPSVRRCAGARVTVCHHRPGTGEQWSVGAGTPGGTHTHHTCTWHLHLHLHLAQGPPPRWSAASAGSWPPSPASGPGSRRTRGTARWSSRGTSRGTSTLQVSGLLFLLVHKIQYQHQQVLEYRLTPSFHVLSVVSPLKCGCLANLLLPLTRRVWRMRRGTQCNTTAARAEEGELSAGRPAAALLRPVCRRLQVSCRQQTVCLDSLH